MTVGMLCSCGIHGMDSDPDAHASWCGWAMWFRAEPRVIYSDISGLSWINVGGYRQKLEDSTKLVYKSTGS